MKKLNNKGFTLVELLAVIIILAIVVGITIPAITSVINNSKNSALGIATESAYDYLRDQYDIYNIDPTSTGSLITTVISKGATGHTTTDTAEIETLGYKSSNVKEVFLKVNHNAATNTADICVKVTQIATSGDYFITSYWDAGTGNLKAGVVSGTGVKNQAGNC